MAKKVRVNVRSAVNNDKIRRETRHGREKIIVPSTTMPDEVVMNGIKYPGDEIAASFETLNGTPAPLGHPTLDGRFLSAHTTEAQIRNGIGAENENARRENGMVHVDKVIDVEFASRSEGGKAVLAAIEAGDPIHTSTGLLCELENVAAGSGHKYVARNIYFDHDAILLDEEGAATPEQGVGMMVNAKGEEFEVINSSLEDDVDRELERAADMAVRALEKQARIPLIESMKAAFKDLLGQGRETNANQGDNDMADDKQFAALSEKVDGLSETVGKIGETIANAVTEAMKPIVEAQNAAAERAAAAEQAERDKVVNKLVEAEVFAVADEAKDIPVAALNTMLEKLGKNAPKTAAPLRPGMPTTTNKRSFKAPAAEEA